MNVLLFSGGLDSTAVAAWTRPDHLFFVDYGQCSADGERRAALQIADELKLPLEIAHIDVSAFGSGDLAGRASISGQSEFWPFRNQFLVTIAAMKFAKFDALEIMIGTVSTDHVHPDGSTAFVDALDKLLSLQGTVSVRAPAIDLTTAELIKRSKIDHNILGWAFSCHTGNLACGQCRGCSKHHLEINAL